MGTNIYCWYNGSVFYKDILKHILKSNAGKLGLQNVYYCEQDNDPKNSADNTVFGVGLCTTGVVNLLSSRANLHLSYNPAGRSHCRLQNHHKHIKHHHRGMGGSPGDVGEVHMT